MGDGLKSPADGKKSRSLPRVSCQQGDADSGLINDSSTREQALPREHSCVAMPHCHSVKIRDYFLSPSEWYIHHNHCVSEFQSLGSVHKTLSKVISVYNFRCCGIISVETSGIVKEDRRQFLLLLPRVGRWVLQYDLLYWDYSWELRVQSRFKWRSELDVELICKSGIRD